MPNMFKSEGELTKGANLLLMPLHGIQFCSRRFQQFISTTTLKIHRACFYEYLPRGLSDNSQSQSEIPG